MATQFAVDLVFKAKGDTKLRKLSNQLQGLDGTAKQGQKSLDGVSNSARRAGREAGTAAGGVNKLSRAVGGLVSAYAAIQAAKFVFFKTAELETQTRSLQVLTGSLKEAQGIISELQSFAAVTPFTSSELVETAKRLKAFGVDTEKLVDTTKRLGDVAGATGAELSGIATAYGQIQAKGRLQGEELLQLQERGISLQGELQKMYGLTGDEFRKALEQGRFSAEAVELALRNLTDTGGQYANGAIAQSDTLNGKFSTLIDGIDNLARALGEVLSPALKTILGEAINVTNAIIDAINQAKLAGKLGLDKRAQKGILDQARKQAEEIVNLRNIADPFERNKVFQQVAAQRERDLLKQYGYSTGLLQPDVTAPKTTSSAPPALLGSTSKTGGGRKGKSEREKQLEREARLVERMGEQFTRLNQSVLDGNYAYGERLNTQQRLNALLLEGFSPEKAQEEVAFETELNRLQRDRAKRIAELRGIEGITQEKLVAGELAINQAFDQRRMSLEEEKRLKGENLELTEAQKKAEEELNAQRQLGADLLNSVGGQLTSTIDTLIQGTDDWNKVLQNTLRSLSSLLLKFGIKALAGTDGEGFFSFLDGSLKGFASGGRPPVGRPSIVGERGPELFVPGTSGTIIPNDQLGGGGGTTVNITLNGVGGGSSTGSGPNQEEAARLARMVEAATVGVIQRERRPGGLLAR